MSSNLTNETSSAAIKAKSSLNNSDDDMIRAERGINSSGDQGEDKDDNSPFDAILAGVNRAGLLDFCSRLRAEREKDGHGTTFASPTIEDPLHGACHVLLPIKFDDDVKWLAKIPGNGTESQFDELSSQALTTEALTMKFLLQNTTIPIPDVLAYDASLNNDLGCPFILLAFIDGLPLPDIWFNKSGTASPDARTTILRDLAAAMFQLSRFSFPSAGSLQFSPSGQPTSIGPLRCIDSRATLDNLFSSSPSRPQIVYFPAGPFPDVFSYLTLYLDHEPPPSDPFQASLAKLLRLFITWLSELETPDPSSQEFVLAHPDFDIQNILVDSEGHLKAILDWDGVAAVPRGLGYESFPSWLTRDWDPAIYGWKEEGRDGEERVWEDSPIMLERHREEYAGFMRAALEEERRRRGGRGWEGRTENSLYVENLFIASAEPNCRFGILEKFVGYIVEKSGEGGLSGLDVFDVAEMITEGTMDGDIEGKLKKGFQGIFRRIEAPSI